MDLFKLLVLSLINEIRAIDIDGKDFKVVKGKKALLNITATTHARSAIQCATQCARSNECTHSNFRNAKCEFLKLDSSGMEIHFEEDADSKYIYPATCDRDQCRNRETCVSNKRGFTCECESGIAEEEHPQECDTIFNCRCYKVYNEAVTWHQARDTCIIEGGKLVEVCDAETMDMLNSLIEAKGLTMVWLGASDEADEGNWEWITGECNFASFQNWNPGQPNNQDGNENYLLTLKFITDDFEWHDAPTTHPSDAFVCEFPIE